MKLGRSTLSCLLPSTNRMGNQNLGVFLLASINRAKKYLLSSLLSVGYFSRNEKSEQ